jgi:hypothetical protein
MRIVPLERLQQFAAINLLSDPGAIGGPVIVPSCAQITLIWALEGARTAHNVLYGRYSGAFAGTQTQANGILSALTSSAAYTDLCTFMPSGLGIAGVSLRDVNTRDQPIVNSNETAAQFGTSVSAALPDEVAAVVTVRTARAGKSGRGRIYVPNFATNALGAGNVIAGAAVTALQNWAATITGAINTQGYVFVLGLRERAAYTGSTGTDHPARPAESVPVTSTEVRDNHWDSQRRRGLK